MTLLEVLQLVVGLPGVLVGPGLAWSFVAFPHHRPLALPRAQSAPGELDVLERAAVTFAMSVALVSLGALLWNGALRLPLGTWGAIALVGLLTVSGAALAVWRKRRARDAAPAKPADRP